MLRAGAGFSTAREPRQAAREATTMAASQAGVARAQAAICFVSSAHAAAYGQIVRLVSQYLGTDTVVGCSARGVLAAGREMERGPGLALLALSGDRLGALRLFVPSLKGRSEAAARELAALARPALGKANLLCVFPDTYNVEPEPFIATLEQELPGVVIVGGGASEDGSLGETAVFCGNAVSSNAVSGLLLAGELEINTGSALGCRLIGRPLRVTAARDNLLMELDHQPALAVLKQVIGPLGEDLERVAAVVYLATALDPDAARLEHGRYLIRNLLGFNERYGVIATGYRPRPGELVGFALRDGEGAREDLKLTLAGLQGTVGQPPAFGLYIDCVARGSALYSIPDHDSAYISRQFPALPIAGLFSGFEIGPVAAATRLLLYSGVLALVSEAAG